MREWRAAYLFTAPSTTLKLLPCYQNILELSEITTDLVRHEAKNTGSLAPILICCRRVDRCRGRRGCRSMEPVMGLIYEVSTTSRKKRTNSMNGGATSTNDNVILKENVGPTLTLVDAGALKQGAPHRSTKQWRRALVALRYTFDPLFDLSAPTPGRVRSASQSGAKG